MLVYYVTFIYHPITSPEASVVPLGSHSMRRPVEYISGEILKAKVSQSICVPGTTQPCGFTYTAYERSSMQGWGSHLSCLLTYSTAYSGS